MSKIVIDLSKYNPINDYTKVANSIDGAIIRCGYRGLSNGKLTEDPLFKKHATSLAALKVPIGVYFFTTAINENEAAEEAAYTYSLIKKYNLTMSFPVFIDSEMSNASKTGRSDKLSKNMRTTVIDIFCKKIQLLGYTAGIYASDSWYVSQLNFEVCKQYKLWVAKYSNNPPKYVSGYCGWQYTSNGSIPGIPGRVDVSHWYDSIGYSNNQTPNNNTNPYVTPTSNLKEGNKGQGVYWLQYELNKVGYKISIDGEFGPLTKEAVISYQESRGLEPDGIVGSITRNALINNKKPVQSDTSTGAKVILANVPLYSSSLSNDPKREISGEYYIWNEDVKNGKIRICKSPDDIKNIFKVVGWVSISDLSR